MSGYLTLLLAAALVPPGQTSIILEQKVISITRNIDGSAALICEISGSQFDNIHWYRYQEGRAPQRLLRYSMNKSESVLDPGFSSEKVRAYKGKDNSCRLILSQLQVSDSGMYHCASWNGAQQHSSPQLLDKTRHMKELRFLPGKQALLRERLDTTEPSHGLRQPLSPRNVPRPRNLGQVFQRSVESHSFLYLEQTP